MEKKADFKEMTKKEIAGFIWDYHKWQIIIGVIVVIALIATVRHFVTRKDLIVQIAMINSNAKQIEEADESEFAEFMELYDYDSAEEEVKVNTMYSFNMSSTSSVETQNFQSFIAMAVAGGLDLMVLNDDEELYKFIAECRATGSLAQYLSEDILKKYEEDIVYAVNPITEEEFPAGIRVEKESWMTEQGYYNGDCIVGVGVGTMNEDEATQMLLYLLGEK